MAVMRNWQEAFNQFGDALDKNIANDYHVQNQQEQDASQVAAQLIPKIASGEIDPAQLTPQMTSRLRDKLGIDPSKLSPSQSNRIDATLAGKGEGGATDLSNVDTGGQFISKLRGAGVQAATPNLEAAINAGPVMDLGHPMPADPLLRNAYDVHQAIQDKLTAQQHVDPVTSDNPDGSKTTEFKPPTLAGMSAPGVGGHQTGLSAEQAGVNKAAEFASGEGSPGYAQNKAASDNIVTNATAGPKASAAGKMSSAEAFGRLLAEEKLSDYTTANSLKKTEDMATFKATLPQPKSAQEKSTQDTAVSGLAGLSDLRQQTADLAAKGQLGAFVGKVQVLQDKAGVPVFTSDANSREASDYLASLNYMAGTMAKLSGRSSMALMKSYADHLNGGASVDQINGQLDAAEGYLKRTAMVPGAASEQAAPPPSLDDRAKARGF